MELNFTKQNSMWIAEFEVSSDFNLHLEGVSEGEINVFLSSVAGAGYARIREATPYPSFGTVYDYDFSGVVWPKFIKVTCPNQPTMAVVTLGA